MHRSQGHGIQYSRTFHTVGAKATGARGGMNCPGFLSYTSINHLVLAIPKATVWDLVRVWTILRLIQRSCILIGGYICRLVALRCSRALWRRYSALTLFL